MTSESQRSRTLLYDLELAQANITRILADWPKARNAFRAHAADGLDRPGEGGITGKGAHGDPTARRALFPDEFDNQRRRTEVAARDLRYLTQSLQKQVSDAAAIPVTTPGLGQMQKCANPNGCPDNEWAVHGLQARHGKIPLCGACNSYKHRTSRHRVKVSPVKEKRHAK